MQMSLNMAGRTRPLATGDFMRSFRFRAAALAAVVSLLATTTASAASLTILHNNDAESSLFERIISGQPYAGAARFVTAVNTTRADALGAGRDVLTLNAGEATLASPVFNAGLPNGPFLDAIVVDRIGYDAQVIGNHEFDFGPNVLAEFVRETPNSGKYLSANLDFSGEAQLQALVGSGRIAKSTIITRGAERYGIVGATTEEIPFITSPGNVITNAVIPAVQAEIDALLAAGVNKIIVVSQLQTPQVDVQLINSLRGIDILVSGGYNPLLRNDIAARTGATAGARDVFGQENVGRYPAASYSAPVAGPPARGFNYTTGAALLNADGKQTYLVSTSGEYEYLGRLDVEFDAAGDVVEIKNTSRPILINSSFAPDSFIQANVINPANAIIASLAANVIAISEVALDGTRGSVRNRETNLGDLMADAFIFQAKQADKRDPSVLQNSRVVGLQNGGGIRNTAVQPAGNISELFTFQTAPFTNFVSVFNDVTPQQLKGLVEFSVSQVGGGGFGQWGGIKFIYNPARAVGDRIIFMEFEDGQDIYGLNKFGVGQYIYTGLLDFVTINFTANGGDNYPFRALGLTDYENIVDETGTTISYQQALFDYLSNERGLDGVVRAADYPTAGEGRIVASAVAPTVPAPAALALFGLGIAGIAFRRRRAA